MNVYSVLMLIFQILFLALFYICVCYIKKRAEAEGAVYGEISAKLDSLPKLKAIENALENSRIESRKQLIQFTEEIAEQHRHHFVAVQRRCDAYTTLWRILSSFSQAISDKGRIEGADALRPYIDTLSNCMLNNDAYYSASVRSLCRVIEDQYNILVRSQKGYDTTGIAEAITTAMAESSKVLNADT